MIGGFLESFTFGATTRQELADELRVNCPQVDADALLDSIEEAAPPWIASASAGASLPAARDTQRLLARIEADALALLGRLNTLRGDERARRLLWHGANHPERVVHTAREALTALHAVAGAAARDAEGGARATPQATIALIAMIADAFEAQGGVATTTEGGAFEGVVEIVVPPLLEAAGRRVRESFHGLTIKALRARR